MLFVRYIFAAETVWLDLRNPASPIRAVKISNSGLSHQTSDLTMASIRESAGKAPNIVFEIISELAGLVAANVRKEWGARV